MAVQLERPAAVAPRRRPAALLRRWDAYSRERFPLASHGVLIFSFCSSNQFLADALVRPGEPMRYDLSSLAAYVTVFCFFLHLRIFDDHKDYAEDCRNFPGRVLQRGGVTLGDLKILGAIALATECVLGALAGPAALVAVLVAIGFSLLMFQEFFVRHWLRRHFLVYASTHMLVIPLLAMVVFGFVTGQYPWTAPPWYGLYACVGFFVAFNWEVSRKIRAPEEEIEGVDSYTRLFGTYGAAYLVLAIRVVDTALVALVGVHLGLSVWFDVVLVALFLVCMVGFFQYRFHTTPATARRMATYAGVYIFAFDLALAMELGRTYGVTFGR